jgi:hypothetical protein
MPLSIGSDERDRMIKHQAGVISLIVTASTSAILIVLSQA